jgi:hypothetical protein
VDFLVRLSSQDSLEGQHNPLSFAIPPQLVFRFSDVTLVDGNSDLSEYKLLFADGRKLRVNAYFHGFTDFMQMLDDRFGNALQEVDH